MENGVLLNLERKPIYWHMPKNASDASIPDSRDFWDVIWENRHQVSGIAHSHPGDGNPWPSHVDITTFAGIEACLGKRLEWWIINKYSMIIVTWCGPQKYDYRVEAPEIRGVEPDSYRDWVTILRSISYGGFERLCKRDEENG